MSKKNSFKNSDERSSKKGKLRNSLAAEIDAVNKANEIHRISESIAWQFLNNGEEGEGIQHQVKPLRRKIASSKWFSLEAAVDDKEDVSGDEDEEDEGAIGDEDPKDFLFKHPLNSTKNDSNLPDKVISFKGVSTTVTARSLLFLMYNDCKYNSILNLKLMLSIKYLIYDLKFVHMVFLVLYDKQFNLVKTPIQFTDELLNRLISNWKTLRPDRKALLHRSFLKHYDDTSLISQQREQVRITEHS
jgi:hypothetical protein